jgi:hypothetical protein
MLSKYINIPVFIISFAIGILFVYLFADKNHTILVYPTHENYKLLQYRDKVGNCYSIEETEVKCPTDPNSISKIPAQS